VGAYAIEWLKILDNYDGDPQCSELAVINIDIRIAQKHIMKKWIYD